MVGSLQQRLRKFIGFTICLGLETLAFKSLPAAKLV